ncbi:MAG: DUF3793 family protein [Lachnospiraceae bacterium]|nr:DUF3793 family protein [Lachnospiraceae bacterium]
MSKDVFEMLCSMDRKKVELQIVLQCAPTLSGLKTSNLLILPREQERSAHYALRGIGLIGYRLAYDRHRVVLLVFRKEMLMHYLKREDVRIFLQSLGYEGSFGISLAHFQKRYQDFVNRRMNFPHEMGIFLGYPLCDVKGFIDNEGDNFRMVGYWKVYQNVHQTKKLFQQFDDIKDDMVCRLSKGDSLETIMKESVKHSLAS